MDIEAEIDRLYSLPLGDFVTARNDLAKTVRGSGQREEAETVKSLPKPNLPAWTVNQLWHHERAAFDRLLEAGAAVRAAVTGGGTDAGQAAAQRGDTAKALLVLAKGLLRADGHPSTAGTHRRISHTLDAVAALGSDFVDPPLGRLTRDLEPQGFDVLTALQLTPAKSPAKSPPESPSKRPSKSPPKKPTRKPTKKTGVSSKRAQSRAASRAARTKKAADTAEKARRRKRIEAERKKLDSSLSSLAGVQQKAEQAEKALAEARQSTAEAAREAKRAEKEARNAAKRHAAARKAETAAVKTVESAEAATQRATTKVETAHRRLKEAGG